MNSAMNSKPWNEVLKKFVQTELKIFENETEKECYDEVFKKFTAETQLLKKKCEEMTEKYEKLEAKVELKENEYIGLIKSEKFYLDIQVILKQHYDMLLVNHAKQVKEFDNKYEENKARFYKTIEYYELRCPEYKKLQELKNYNEKLKLDEALLKQEINEMKEQNKLRQEIAVMEKNAKIVKFAEKVLAQKERIRLDAEIERLKAENVVLFNKMNENGDLSQNNSFKKLKSLIKSGNNLDLHEPSTSKPRIRPPSPTYSTCSTSDILMKTSFSKEELEMFKKRKLERKAKLNQILNKENISKSTISQKSKTNMENKGPKILQNISITPATLKRKMFDTSNIISEVQVDNVYEASTDVVSERKQLNEEKSIQKLSQDAENSRYFSSRARSDNEPKRLRTDREGFKIPEVASFSNSFLMLNNAPMNDCSFLSDVPDEQITSNDQLASDATGDDPNELFFTTTIGKSSQGFKWF